MYALLEDYKIKVPDVDRAGYATMDSAYASLKALVEDVEGTKDALISKYSAELDTGGLWLLFWSYRLKVHACTAGSASSVENISLSVNVVLQQRA